MRTFKLPRRGAARLVRSPYLLLFVFLALLFFTFRPSPPLSPATSLSALLPAPPVSVLPAQPVSVPPSPPPPLLSSIVVLAHRSNSSLTRATVAHLVPLATAHRLDLHVYHYSPADRDALADIPVIHHLHTSPVPYDDFLHPLRHRSTLFVRAGATLPPRAIPRLIRALTDIAIVRPDIAVVTPFALDPLVKPRSSDHDHHPESWTATPQSAPFLSPLLYSRALDAFVPVSTNVSDVVTVFAEWLRLRRSDWYKYPAGPGVDATPLGLSALPAANWTRAPWNVWFSKFLTEYRLFVLHLPSDELASESQLTDPYTLRAFDAQGKRIRQPPFQTSLNQLSALARNQRGTLSFTLVNHIFLATARSWLCNVDVAGFRPPGLVWAATDSQTRSALDNVGNSATVMLDDVRGGKDTGHEFGNPGYWKLMLERTQLIGQMLARGIAVFAFETDAIWLEDPQPWIRQLVQQEADIVGTINTRAEVSGNFFFLRPTLATRRLWFEIISEFEKAYNKAGFEGKKKDSWTYIENDQSLLTKLVLRNETWRRSYPLSFLTLDMEKFVDGRWYTMDEGFYTSKRSRKPVVINNNFVIGVAEKTERAKKWGHWFWDEEKQKCLDGNVKKAVTGNTTFLSE